MGIAELGVALFGANRCLWGSNYPIEKLWTGYSALLDAHRQAAGGLSHGEQQAIFNDTIIDIVTELNKVKVMLL